MPRIPAAAKTEPLKQLTHRRVQFLNTDAGSSASAISGAENFTAYLSAYSDDFNALYVGYLSVDWTETFSFHQILSSWVNTGSSVTSSTNTLATPTSLQSLGVKLNGPLYANEVETR